MRAFLVLAQSLTLRSFAVMLGVVAQNHAHAIDVSRDFQKPGKPINVSVDYLGAFDLNSPMFRKSSGKPLQQTVSAKSIADTQLFESISPSVVLIQGQKGNGYGLGSGSVISADGLVLTNWHVLDGLDNITVMFLPVDGNLDAATRIKAQAIKVDQIADLALLKLDTPVPGLKPLRFAQFDGIRVGMDVHAIGHPKGEAWTYTKGVVSQVRRNFNWGHGHTATVIQTQTPINPGNSGGPLLSDAGLILGVNAFMLNDATLLNFAIGVDEIRAFLSRPEHRYTPLKNPEASTPVPSKPQQTAQTCKAQALKEKRDAKEATHYIYFDLDCDNRIDAVLEKPDDVGKAIIFDVDTDKNGKLDIYIVDKDRDGKWDFSLLDTDEDGRIDRVGHHPDGAMMPTSTTPYVDRDEGSTQQASASQPSPARSLEPSEDVIRALVQARFDRKANKIQRMASSCQNGQAGALGAMLCLSVAPLAAMGGAEPLHIDRLRKLGCAPASGKAGYVCDYLIETSHPIDQMFGGLVDRNGAGQARFLESADGWVMITGG